MRRRAEGKERTKETRGHGRLKGKKDAELGQEKGQQGECRKWVSRGKKENGVGEV